MVQIIRRSTLMTSRVYSLILAALLLRAGISAREVVGAERPQIQRGDTILVLRDTDLQAGTEKLAVVEAGTELVAGQVRDEWVAVRVERHGTTVSGWLPDAQLCADPKLAFLRLTLLPSCIPR
jgi:hypothetical protein